MSSPGRWKATCAACSQRPEGEVWLTVPLRREERGRQKIRVRFLRYCPPLYPQFWGEFSRNLSALDLLLCLGKNRRAILNKGSYLYAGD